MFDLGHVMKMESPGVQKSPDTSIIEHRSRWLLLHQRKSHLPGTTSLLIAF